MNKIRRRLERGQSIAVLGMGLLVLLAMFAWYVFDVGKIGLAQMHAQNTLDLAAQKAGNSIDVPTFLADQDTLLSGAAQNVALGTIQTAPQHGYSLTVSSVQVLYGGQLMEIQGDLHVPLGFLSRMFGIDEGRRHFRVMVSPSYGIQKEED